MFGRIEQTHRVGNYCHRDWRAEEQRKTSKMFLKLSRLYLSAGVGMLELMLVGVQSAVSLPPPEDIPEEVLRTEIITEARSPVDGKPLTAAEYAKLQAQLQARPIAAPLSPKVKETILLLRLRRVIRTVLPFLPI